MNIGYKIAVIGAGPAGCTLARLLSKNTSADVTIYEAEESLNFRSQGGTLDLRHDGGLRAIKEAGLWDQFQKYARYDGEAIMIGDKNLKAWVKMSAPSVEQKNPLARPEIDRRLLRTLLYDSLPVDMVRWSHKVKRLERDEKTSGYVLHFADGTTAGGFDLVVGADGAWSKARAVLTDIQPSYYGIHYASLTISNVEKRHPKLYDLVNRGSVFTYSDGKGIAVQYLSDGSLNIGASGRLPESWMEEHGLNVHDGEAVKAALLEDYLDWHPLLRQCIEHADADNIQTRPLYMLPLGHMWEHRQGCTVIGDAAHLTTPFAGVGVNIAMQDAVQLSKAVEAAEKAGDTDSLDREVQQFEQNMFVRMGKAMSMSWSNCYDMYFVPDAPRARIQNYVTRVMRSEVSPVLAPFFAVGIQVFFFFLKLIQ
jgi:2-polyprenyl-6-methoxyphenol hydroxylase-like FAD-dependent oxidoreductase